VRLCLVTNEYFAWGGYGGYGSSARILATELARRGIDVSVVTPRRDQQQPIEVLDGVRVLSFRATSVRQQIEAYRACDADIYHCLEPSLSAYIAQWKMPDRVHLVTCRYVRFGADMAHEIAANLLEWRLKPIVSLAYEQNAMVRLAVQRADAVVCEAEFERSRSQTKYHLTRLPDFVPIPFKMPSKSEPKNGVPQVCFVGRWEKRKYPELFLELASRFPEVRFVALGEAQNPRRDQWLRKRYGALPNLTMPGFIDQFRSTEFDQILGRSWILVNTSQLEGLPRTFLEAAARGCAILSRVDPDGFASRGGYCAASGDFAHGLRTLLQADVWRERGEHGCRYVREHYHPDISVERHARLYDLVLKSSGGQRDGRFPDRARRSC
jgi:glycosyltransferase involved in cell wall biosynthesis